METDLHHRASLRALVVAGIWPLQIKGHKILRNLHLVYMVIVSLYFIWFVACQYIDILQRLDESVFNLVNNLTLSLLYTITILKAISIRVNSFSKLVEQVRTIEKIIMECDDEEVRTIHMTHVRWNTKLSNTIMALAYFTILLMFISPVLAMYTDPAVMDGEVARPLPLVTYFPFDQEKYYWICFAMHVFFGSLGSTATGSTDAFFWSLAIFAIGQLKILQYKLRNLNEHAQWFVDKGLMTKDEAVQHCALKCILMHKMLIEYVTDLDRGMKYVMFIDFIVCSLQISTVGFQAIVVDSMFEKMTMFEFLFVTLVQLFAFYWHANEILLESENVSLAIGEGNMYDYPQSTQKDLLFVMLRAQKPLTLNVGPFYPMSTSTLLSILRVTYSYVALLHQFYGDD